nr:hypothetical protein [Streptococcus gallolyticus]
MELTVSTRDRLVQLLTSEYTIPDELVDCVKVAIKQYSTKNYTDDAVDRMVRTPQSLSKGLALLRERNGKNDLSLFRGIISEWLVCAEYNALKNKGSVVLTITNPDPSSKADLLHIIDTGKGYKAVPGPDIKSGGSTYVFNQWKKIVNDRYEIPMVDIDGILTTEEGIKQLTQKQRIEFEELSAFYPNKRPLDTAFDKTDINRIVADYLKFIEFDVYPSTQTSLSIKDIDIKNVKAKLYSGELSTNQTYQWLTFSSETKDIFNSQSKVEDISIEEDRIELDSDKTVGQSEDEVKNSSPKKEGAKFTNSAVALLKRGARVVKSASKKAFIWAGENPDKVLYAFGLGFVALNSIINVNNYNEVSASLDSEDSLEEDSQCDVFSDSILSNILEDEETIEQSDGHHASKHIRDLPPGQKASPEKIRTAEENGFSLKEGQTWVKEY